ncbi:MAG: alkaline phosphatase family protein [Planctomycetota bacterium]
MKRRINRRQCLWIALALLGVVGCSAIPDIRDRPFGHKHTGPETIDKTAAVVFFLDGVNAEIFRDLLDGARLPNIKKYLVDRGLYIERCTANVPSVTLANETSVVTGLFPGNHGITGINWFDRNALIWRDYATVAQKNFLDSDHHVPTIFERLRGHITFSIFYQAHRGATKFVENWTSAGPPYFFGWYEMVDRISLCRFSIVAEVSRLTGEFPKFTIAYLLGPDMEGYRSGVSNSAYRHTLEHADAQIGRALRDFESAGILDKLILVLVSDHGMGDVQNQMVIEDFLHDTLGLAVARRHLWEETSFQDRLHYYKDFSCILPRSGERYCAIYLRRPRDDGAGFENWLKSPEPRHFHSYPNRKGEKVDVVARLLRERCVDMAAYAVGPNAVRLYRKDGVVEVRRHDRQSRMCSYHVLEGVNPLGYEGWVPNEMLTGKPFDSRRWLEATADTQFPDLLPQILAYFDSPLAGDIALFATPLWDFGSPNKGAHGGLRPVDMHMPMILAGPGVPHKHMKTARSVDLVPTLLHLLNEPPAPGLDGVNLLDAKAVLP